MPQIPVSSSSRAAAAVAHATPDTAEPGFRSASQTGPRLEKKYAPKTRAVSSIRPLVLVYSPSTTMAMTINTAAIDDARKPAA